MLLSARVESALVLHYPMEREGARLENHGSQTVRWDRSDGMEQIADGKFGAAKRWFSGKAYCWTSQLATANVDVSSFSLSFHVRLAKGDASHWKDLLSIGTASNAILVLEKTDTGSVALYNMGDVGGVRSENVDSGVSIADGQWHHVGIVSDGETLTLYLDGAVVGQTAFTGKGKLSVMQLASRYGDASFAISADLDDIAIYDMALSTGQMKWLHHHVAVDQPANASKPEILLGIGGISVVLKDGK